MPSPRKSACRALIDKHFFFACFAQMLRAFTQAVGAGVDKSMCL
jgi:hypothetical protein